MKTKEVEWQTRTPPVIEEKRLETWTTCSGEL